MNVRCREKLRFSNLRKFRSLIQDYNDQWRRYGDCSQGIYSLTGKDLTKACETIREHSKTYDCGANSAVAVQQRRKRRVGAVNGKQYALIWLALGS